MRLKIEIEGDERYNTDKFHLFIEDFPERLQQGDLINLVQFIDKEHEESLTEGQLEQIYALSAFTVDYVCWYKDDKGVYLTVSCDGE